MEVTNQDGIVVDAFGGVICGEAITVHDNNGGTWILACTMEPEHPEKYHQGLCFWEAMTKEDEV